MIVSENPVSRLQTFRNGAALLTQKAVEELRDWRQFRDPARRNDLIMKGYQRMRSLTTPIENNIKYIDTASEWHFRDDGLAILTMQNIPIVACIFPSGTRILPVFPKETGSRWRPTGMPKPGAIFESTTAEFSPFIGQAPTHGCMRNGEILFQFKRQRFGDRIQHGGILTDDEGKMQLVNYRDLFRAVRQGKQSTGTVMQAEWYIDSGTQLEVLARKNVHRWDQFNAVGQAITPEGVVTFTINSSIPSRNNLSQGITRTSRALSSITECVATANFVAEHLGATYWNLCGLEYDGGGTFVPDGPQEDDSMYLHGPYFAVYLPGNSIT